MRLSLQHISDLASLVQCDTLPRIKHLHVTLEKTIDDTRQLHNRYKDSSCSTLYPEDFIASRASLSHLRTLYLRQVPIRNVIILIEHLRSMSQVESLILVNCNVKGVYRC